MRVASTPFAETLRSLDGDRPVRVLLGIGATLVLSSLWLVWLSMARLPVFVTSSAAQLRASDLPVQVVAEVDGRVESVAARLGAEVAAGQVLLTLDTRSNRLRLDEIAAGESASRLEAEAVERELAFRRRALEQARDEHRQALEMARQEAESARLAAEVAAEDLKRSTSLGEQGVLAPARVAQDRASARQLASALLARQAAVASVRLGGERVSEVLQAEIAALDRQLAELRGDVDSWLARRAQVDDDVERHVLRAPMSGRLADIGDLSTGSAVRQGDLVATVLPEQGVLAVGWFPDSEALARIRSGQPAQLRLDGFPWTEYGSLDATVQRVAAHERDGQIRVECRLAASAGESAVPLEHGLRGSLIIEIERASPLSLLLRSVGKRLVPAS